MHTRKSQLLHNQLLMAQQSKHLLKSSVQDFERYKGSEHSNGLQNSL